MTDEVYKLKVKIKPLESPELPNEETYNVVLGKDGYRESDIEIPSFLKLVEVMTQRGYDIDVYDIRGTECKLGFPIHSTGGKIQSMSLQNKGTNWNLRKLKSGGWNLEQT